MRFAAVSTAALLMIFANRGVAEVPDEVPALLKAEPVKLGPKDDAMQKLLKERYNEALAEASQRNREVVGARGNVTDLLASGQRLMTAGLELNGKAGDQAAFLEKYVAFLKQVEKVVKARVDVGLAAGSPADLHQAKYARADAEIRLLRVKAKLQEE